MFRAAVESTLKKTLVIAGGFGLLALAVVVSPLPGPGGLPIALVGAAVLLKASPTMRRHWIKAKRRWPKAVAPVDRLLRRRKRLAAT